MMMIPVLKQTKRGVLQIQCTVQHQLRNVRLRSLSHVDIVIIRSDADGCSHPNDASPEHKQYLTVPGILLGLLDPKCVAKHRQVTTNQHCVASQKSKYLLKCLFPRGSAL
jgi:hypothetical protein